MSDDLKAEATIGLETSSLEASSNNVREHVSENYHWRQF